LNQIFYSAGAELFMLHNSRPCTQHEGGGGAKNLKMLLGCPKISLLKGVRFLFEYEFILKSLKTVCKV